MASISPGRRAKRCEIQRSRWMLRRLSLSSRLTLALSASALLLLGGGGFWQVSAEESDLRRAVERELRLLGRSLQVAFENALRDRQPEDVEETLRELERIDPAVDIFVYERNGRLLAASTGAVEPPGGDAPAPRSEVRFRTELERPVVELRLPLRIVAGQPPATLVLTQPLRGMNADLAATRERVILSTGAFVLVVLLVTLAASRYWVSRPLGRMVERMRRVRAGDLSPPARGARPAGDEVGATLDEFDALVRDLAETRTRLEAQEERRRQLELALREVDKLATVGQLAAGLAHEVGSPLQILDGRIAGLAAKADDPAETRRLARILGEQTQRITRIVSRLTDLARRRVAPARWVEVAPPVGTVVELLGGEARRRGVELTLEVPGPVPRVHGDPDSLQQVALNLLRNALEATPAGGRITVRIERGELERAGGGTAPSARIEVRDTGRGMDAEALERAFEAFFTTRAPEGSGLGLAVVKGIVDDHGGRIRAESELGRGTRFVVDLPGEEGGRSDTT